MIVTIWYPKKNACHFSALLQYWHCVVVCLCPRFELPTQTCSANLNSTSIKFWIWVSVRDRTPLWDSWFELHLLCRSEEGVVSKHTVQVVVIASRVSYSPTGSSSRRINVRVHTTQEHLFWCCGIPSTPHIMSWFHWRTSAFNRKRDVISMFKLDGALKNSNRAALHRSQWVSNSPTLGWA